MRNLKDIQGTAAAIVSSALSDISDVSIVSSAYIKSLDGECPTHITFDRPSKSKICIFCLYEGMTVNDKLCSNGLWNFYVLPTSALQQDKTITYDYLISLKPSKCTYFELLDCVGMIGGVAS